MSKRLEGGYLGPKTATAATLSSNILNRYDPYFDKVSLLLPMTGSNGSTSFPDSSLNALTVTANGNAQISTAQSVFGGSSGYFDGSGDYLQIPNSVNANFDSGDFAIEFWMYASAQGLAPIVHQTSYSSSLGWIIWNYDGVNAGTATRKLTFMVNGASFILTTSSDAYADNTWAFIAVVKSGAGSNNIKIYSNGTVIATGTYATALNNATQPLMVGGIINGVSWNGTSYYNGYISHLRITKGVARDNVVPTGPFPDLSFLKSPGIWTPEQQLSRLQAGTWP